MFYFYKLVDLGFAQEKVCSDFVRYSTVWDYLLHEGDVCILS